MAQNNLELSIYTFILKQKNVNKNEKSSEFYNLGAFYRQHFAKGSDDANISQEELYKRFMTEIIQEFHNEFILNRAKTKGFSTDSLKAYSNQNVIDGILNGGDRGSNHKIYKLKDNKKSISTLQTDELVALPHYFKIWTPPNSQVGVLMIQNYSNAGINTLLLDFLKFFYSKHNTTFLESRHVPEEIQKNFINKSIVKRVVFTKTKMSSSARESFNHAFSDSSGLKMKIDISGFKPNTSIANFVDELKKSKKLIGVDLSKLDILENEDLQTVLYYEDDKGKKAHAKIESTFQINPTILLPLELYKEDTVDYESIRKYTDGVLEIVKKELNYTTEK